MRMGGTDSRDRGIRTYKEWFHYSLICPFSKGLLRVSLISGTVLNTEHKAIGLTGRISGLLKLGEIRGK